MIRGHVLSRFKIASFLSPISCWSIGERCGCDAFCACCRRCFFGSRRSSHVPTRTKATMTRLRCLLRRAVWRRGSPPRRKAERRATRRCDPSLVALLRRLVYERLASPNDVRSGSCVSLLWRWVGSRRCLASRARPPRVSKSYGPHRTAVGRPMSVFMVAPRRVGLIAPRS